MKMDDIDLEKFRSSDIGLREVLKEQSKIDMPSNFPYRMLQQIKEKEKHDACRQTTFAYISIIAIILLGLSAVMICCSKQFIQMWCVFHIRIIDSANSAPASLIFGICVCGTFFMVLNLILRNMFRSKQ